MKTGISAIKSIHSYLVSKGAKASTGITGNIYWLNKPKNSVKEDIVISTLAMNAEEMQEGILNVNIHMPNLVLTNDDTQPNVARFEAISTVLVGLLADVYGSDYNFKIDEPATIVPDGSNWFCNIRIRYYTIRN